MQSWETLCHFGDGVSYVWTTITGRQGLLVGHNRASRLSAQPFGSCRWEEERREELHSCTPSSLQDARPVPHCQGQSPVPTQSQSGDCAILPTPSILSYPIPAEQLGGGMCVCVVGG